MSELGHVVFYVRDLQESLRFYSLGVGGNFEPWYAIHSNPFRAAGNRR
ncbi:MAG: hypothetical protein GY703_06970 [Gammaproteobacteria bacterium]|nr:hypothetical protein [Gammaproteobacteria bacterium]